MGSDILQKQALAQGNPNHLWQEVAKSKENTLLM